MDSIEKDIAYLEQNRLQSANTSKPQQWLFKDIQN